MPIYEYFCASCKQEFQALRSIAQADNANCKTCGQPAERLISNFSFKSNTFTAPKLKPNFNRPLRSHETDAPEPSQPTRPGWISGGDKK